MRLLLDTHVFIWLQTEPYRLGARLALLQDPANRLLVSAVVPWEIAIKVAAGRLPLPDPVRAWVQLRMASIGAEPVAVQHEHALAVAELPMLHRDPFDRLLVCQSLALRVPIVTADPAITQYGGDVVRVD